MIKPQYESSFEAEKGADREVGYMMHMLIRHNQVKSAEQDMGHIRPNITVNIAIRMCTHHTKMESHFTVH